MRLVKYVSAQMDGIASQIALSHTLFNIILVLLFLPLVGVLARVLTRLVPGAPVPEMRHLCYFDNRLIDTPALALQRSASEILRMRDMCSTMLDVLRVEWVTPERDEEREQRVFRGRDDLDTMQTEIVTFISHVLRSRCPAADGGRAAAAADTDVTSRSGLHRQFAEDADPARRQQVAISETGMSRCSLHDRSWTNCGLSGRRCQAGDRDVLARLRNRQRPHTGLFKEYRQQSMDRLAAGIVSPVSCVYIMDALHAYRKIKDHGFNIAEAVAGVK